MRQIREQHEKYRHITIIVVTTLADVLNHVCTHLTSEELKMLIKVRIREINETYRLASRINYKYVFFQSYKLRLIKQT